MSLFPAYAQNLDEKNIIAEVTVDEGATPSVSESSVSPTREAQLLSSDDDEAPAAPCARADSAPLDSDDYYLDRKFDCGNLRVSTLYYPGRPQYETQKRVSSEPARRVRRRYFEAPPDADDERAAAELAQRTAAYRRALAERPADQQLWLDFIHFQERHRDAEAALAAAGEAATRLPRAERVRAQLHRLRARVLPPQRRLELLRGELEHASEPALAAELWLRLLSLVAERGGAELDACAAAALGATRALPQVYPHVLYVYGGYLRAAGLWERLVLLLELATSMNFEADAFPPPPDDERLERVERKLQDVEDEAARSGLPLSTVWVRVERARAAAHWRGAPAPAADPQRCPQPAHVAELLRPARGPGARLLLLAAALRLAKVPLLPCAGYVARCADGAREAAGDARAAAEGEALLALLRAARRLPPAHASRAAPLGARRLVALLVDPPHYFSDDAGYLSWVRALWDACCGWSAGPARSALLSWRLRWLHALALLLPPGAAEARRLRLDARLALKRWAGADPLPYAQFARLELAAAGPAPARRAALRALRALAEPAAPAPRRLYAARVLCEVAGPGDPARAWATACAVLRAPVPPDDGLRAPPPPRLLSDALRECEAKCTDIEAQLEAEAGAADDDADGDALLAALLPADAEWAAARARLAPASRRGELLRRVAGAGAGAGRYWEQSACALVSAAAREHAAAPLARALAPQFPHSALLALAAGVDASTAGAPTSHVGALARALPPLLRAAESDWAPHEAARAAAACARAARGGAGGALLAAARLEAGARAAGARGALLGALEALGAHKWLLVRGAALVPAEAAALGDVLLERELRAHALLDELAPLPDTDHQ